LKFNYILNTIIMQKLHGDMFMLYSAKTQYFFQDFYLFIVFQSQSYLVIPDLCGNYICSYTLPECVKDWRFRTHR